MTGPLFGQFCVNPLKKIARGSPTRTGRIRAKMIEIITPEVLNQDRQRSSGPHKYSKSCSTCVLGRGFEREAPGTGAFP